MPQKHEFVDCFDAQHVSTFTENTCRFIELHASVQTQLGENAYLLDVYLESLLKTLNEMDAQDATVEGFEAGRKLYLIVQYEVWDREWEHSSHPFARAVRNFIAQNPLDAVDCPLCISVYYIAVADAWRKFCLQEAADTYLKQCLKADITPRGSVQLYNEIRVAMDDSLMLEQLMELFAARHCAVLPLAAYSQGLASHLNYEMMQHDESTLHRAFQLWLSSGIGTM